MVRILPNGDIVADDNAGGSNKPSPRDQQPRPRRGQIQHDQADPVPHGPAPAGIFDTANQRLSEMGVPQWNIGPYVVEPVVSAGFLLALLLMGFKGLLFAGILFFVSKWSQGRSANQGGYQGQGQGHQEPRGSPPGGTSSRGGHSWGNSGHRLGNS